jgi:acetyl esterase
MTQPLDPVLVDMAARWKAAGVPDLYEGCLGASGGPVSRERARNVRAFLYPPPSLPTGKVESKSIDGPHGPIPVRIAWPVAGEPIGTVAFFHGGGFVLGDIDSHWGHAVRLANRAQVVVVSVDYRLAPECRFPQGVDDCFAATRWANDNRPQLGGAANPLAVAGDSAGGNFAAAVAVLCRDGGIALKAQLLIYPATDLTRNTVPEQAYLGLNVPVVGKDPKASPLFTPTLKGVASAIVGVGLHDFLYKDNLAYVAKLKADGAEVLLRDFPTLNHGFFSFTAISKDSEEAANQLCADLKALLER